MARREKSEWPAYPEKQGDLEQLDQLAVLDLKVSKEMLETEDHPVMLALEENQDHQELLVNLADQERTVWMDFQEYLENRVNLVDLAQSVVSVKPVCLDLKDTKVNKGHLEFPVKWEDLAATENEDHKENLANKAFKVFKVSPENLEDLALLDQKVYPDPKDLVVLRVMMDHRVHLDFLEKEAEPESKVTRVTLDLLDLKDLLVTLDHLECPENQDQRVTTELLENVDLPVHLVKMDKEDQSDQLAQLDQKDLVALPVQEEHKASVDHVEDLEDRVLLENRQVIKRFWKSAAELSKMRLQEPWLDLDHEELLLDHQVHQVMLDHKETKVPLDHLDLLDRTASKVNLDYKVHLEFPDPKDLLELRVTVVPQSLEHLAKLASLVFLDLKGLLVMAEMVAMVKLVHLD